MKAAFSEIEKEGIELISHQILGKEIIEEDLSIKN